MLSNLSDLANTCPPVFVGSSILGLSVKLGPLSLPHSVMHTCSINLPNISPFLCF